MTIKFKNILIFVILLFSNFILFSQQFNQQQLDLQDNAFKLFLDEKYEEATPLFSQLLSLFPKDPNFNYGYGACLVETNKQIDNAIKYLFFAANKSSNPIILYYLGRAYHLTYKFDDALKYYNKFKEAASGSDMEKVKIDQLIDMANNGKELIKFISDLTVIDNKKIKSENFFYSYELQDFGGKLIIKPIELRTKFDKKKEKHPIIFLPSDSSDIYYSSFGDNKANSKDIFKIKKMKGGKWAIPENLGPIINTKYDEDFPYYNTKSRTIYFSSKGHNSMGGYDIFKSLYDTTSKKWSKPVNMDFPTNTPYDDFLFVTDSVENYAYFSSDRETYNEQMSVYKIEVDKNPIVRQFTNLEEVVQKSKLDITPILVNNNKIDNNNNKKKDISVNNNNQNNIKKQVLYNKNEIVKNAKSIADSLNFDSKNIKKEAMVSYIVANNNNNLAKIKYNESEKIYKSLQTIQDEKLRKNRNNVADSIRYEADNLTNDAVYSLTLADNLNTYAKDNNSYSDSAYFIVNQLLNDSISNGEELNKKFNSIKKHIKSSQISSVEVEFSNQNTLNEKYKKNLKSYQDSINAITKEIDKNDLKLNSLIQSLYVQKDNNIKNKLNKEIDSLKSNTNKNIIERRNLKQKNDRLISDNKRVSKNITTLQNIRNTKLSINDSDMAMVFKRLDKTKLTQDINNKFLIAQANQAKIEKENANKYIIADNIKSKYEINNNQGNNNDVVVNQNVTKDKKDDVVVNQNVTKDKKDDVVVNQNVAKDKKDDVVVNQNITKDKKDDVVVNQNITKDKKDDVVVNQNIAKDKKDDVVVNQNIAKDKKDDVVVNQNVAKDKKDDAVVNQNIAKDKKDDTVVNQNIAKDKKDDVVVNQNITNDKKDDTVVNQNIAKDKKDDVVVNQNVTKDNNKTRQDTSKKLVVDNINKFESDKNVITNKNQNDLANNNKQKNITTVSEEEEVQLLYNQAKNDEQISDSLAFLITEKRNSLKNITNKSQQELVQNEINDLEKLKIIKKTQSDKNFDLAYKKQQILTDKNNNITNETKTTVSIFPFASDSINNLKQNQYEKALFVSNYYSKIITEQNKKLDILQNSQNNTSDNTTKIQIGNEISKLNKSIENNKFLVAKSNNEINKLTKNNEVNKSSVSDDELLVDATHYKPEFTYEFSESQKDSLVSSDNHKIKAIQQLDEYNKTNKQLIEIDSSINNTGNIKLISRLKKEKQKLSDKSYQQYISYNSSVDVAYKNEFNVYENLLNENRIKVNDKNIALANQLEKESEQYYNKSENIKRNIDIISNNEDKITELNKANNFQKIAIEKRKYALDLYLKSKKQMSNDVVKIENSTNNKNQLFKNEITLTPIESGQLNNFKNETNKADLIKSDALKNLDYIKEKRQIAKTLHSKESQDNLLKGFDKTEYDYKQKLVEAYKLYSKADSTKFILNKNIFDKITSGNIDTLHDKAIVNQYLKDATINFNEAIKCREKIKSLTNNDEIIKELELANEFENKALAFQDLALEKVTHNNLDLSLANNEFVKLDILDVINQPVYVDDVVKVKTQRIFQNMIINDQDIKSLNTLAEKQFQSDSLNKVNIDLNNKINYLITGNESIQDEKQKKTNQKLIEDFQIKKDKNIAQLNDNFQFINSSLFNFYNNNLNNYRSKNNTLNTRKGEQLENDSKKYYDEAQNLRNLAKNEKDFNKRNNYLNKANNLELLAVVSLEKSMGLYLNLKPTSEDIKQYALINKNINKSVLDSLNNLLVADNDVNNKTVITKKDTTQNKLIVENNKNKNINTNKTVITRKDTTQNKLIVENNKNKNINTNKTVITRKDTTQNKLIVENDKNKNINTNKTVITRKDTSQDKLIVENNKNKNINTNKTVVTNKDTTKNKLIVENNKNKIVNDNKKNISKKDSVKNKLVVDNNTKKDINKNIKNEKTINDLNITIKTLVMNDDFGFSVLPVSGYNDKNPIPFNIKLPEGIIFKVQIGAFNAFVKPDNFKGLNPLYSEQLPNSQYIKYLVGLFRTLDAAKLVLQDVKNMGFNDAFIVAYNNGVRIAIYEAMKIIQGSDNDFKDTYYLIAKNETTKIKNRTFSNVAAVSADYKNINEIKGLLYTVQIGVFKNVVKHEQLNNISPVYFEQTPYGFIRYTTGIFNNFTKASLEKDKIVALGITDAFVACYNNGIRVSNDDAKKIIKNNKNVTFAPDVNIKLPEQIIKEVKRDVNKNNVINNIPNISAANLSFKVQIGAFKEQVPTDMVNTFIRVSANRGLDIIKTPEGMTIYTVGKFKSYDEALQMRGILKNDGLKDAFIVAFDGNKKVSVEVAKRILK